MNLFKVFIFAITAAATVAAPVSQSYIQSSGDLGSHGPVVAYSQAPVVSYSHAPVVSYAPVAVQHAPVKVEVEHYAPANYEFKYGVNDPHTHDIKEQAEKREGDKVVGHYSLLEPDGTTRTVKYTADHHNGFNAVVTRSGHASHPATPVKVAVPVQKVAVAAAPVLSYAHAAPVLSYAQAAPVVAYSQAPSYSHGSNSVSYSTNIYHH